MIDAKLKGEGVDLSADVPEFRAGNVIDLKAEPQPGSGGEKGCAGKEDCEGDAAEAGRSSYS